MPDIIAHPLAWPLRAFRALAARAGSACPACAGAARGGRLCPPCVADVLKPPHGGAPRCLRCALRLAPALMPGGLGADAPLCADCLLHPPAFARTIAAFDYEPPFDILIQQFKGQHRHAMAGALADLLYQAWLERGDTMEPPLHAVIPIPASRASLRRRGFNPAGELAATLAARAALPVWRAALHRQREDGRRQASLGRRQREAAVQGLYRCTRPVPGLHVALVDDVMTTGSTVDAAARALLQAGAARVTVLVAARTPAQR